MKPKVFIGSSSEALRVVRIVAKALSETCDVFAWDTNPVNPSQFLFEGLLEISESVDFAIFVLSPDDGLHYRNKRYYAPRDNVIFEAGIFMSKLGRERVFLGCTLFVRQKVKTLPWPSEKGICFRLDHC